MATVLKVGDSVIRRVRLINKVAGDPAKGQNYQIELQQQLVDKNILALFLPSDTRVNAGKAQLAWRAIEPSVFHEHFNVSDETKTALDKLTLSSGLKPNELQENVHYVNMEIINPTVNGSKLGVQIIETLTKPHERANPKINPSTGEVLTYQGQPIYRTASVEFAPKNVFIAHDREPVAMATPAVNNAVAGAVS